MLIGEVSKQTHISLETIRYYEKIGLTQKPKRNANNYRNYTEKDVEKLRFIHNCRILDLNHNEIKSLIDVMDNYNNNNCQQAIDIINEHLIHVKNKIEQLEQLIIKLNEIKKECSNELEQQCNILNTLKNKSICEDNLEVNNTHSIHDFSHKN